MGKNSILALALAAALTVSAGAAQAQDTACELHVWPGQNFSATTTGFFGSMGGAVDYALNDAIHGKDNRSRQAQIANALDTEGQLTVLRSMNLAELFGLSQTNVVYHEQPMPLAGQTSKTRNSDSASSCYAELVVGYNSYTKAALSHRIFETSFAVRDFGSARNNPIRIRAAAMSGLRFFPPKEGEDQQPAFDELRAAFKQNLGFFAEKASKKLRSRRAKVKR